MSRRRYFTRRALLQTSVAAGTLAATRGVANSALADEPSKEKVKAGAVVLFQGDSITDAGRDRNSTGPNNPGGLGRGYPFLLASELLRDYADPKLKVFNRGISGNKVPDLQTRWQADCLDLKPDVLSILIGVNDIWHKLNGRYEGTVKDYETGFQQLVEETRTKLPEVRLVICEPFVLRCGAVNEKWFPEFDERREAAIRVAEKAGATLVRFQAMFDKAVEQTPPEHWAGDGVHPSLAGHSLMAKTWRETTGI